MLILLLLHFILRGWMKQDYTIIKTYWTAIPVHKHLFKVNNRNPRETCSRLRMKTPEWHDWHCFCVLIVKFEYISHSFLVFLMMTFNMYLFPGTYKINSLHNAVFTVNTPSDLTISSTFSLVTRGKLISLAMFHPLYILFDSRKSRHLILVLFQYSRMSFVTYASETFHYDQ